ncbi:MAG TPA: 2-C-methyl-D-erythritol 2,4-cyclodiphosphate synthase [Actinobacteria bacterium]|nr:2-C-methyl-D-erythritol 2,4-cyclodiphosphate synthase [Actinomycetota bacterium]
MRVGIGFDAHRFTPGRPLVLGGVTIPYPLGLAGHSDADVILHALIDALLGAAAAGDIGRYFPPGEERYKGISSLKLLEKTKAILDERGYRVVNVDAVVVLEEPWLSNYRDEMREKIATVLSMDIEEVSIKAKTTEGLGFTGRKEGIAAYSVALLEKVDGGN